MLSAHLQLLAVSEPLDTSARIGDTTFQSQLLFAQYRSAAWQLLIERIHLFLRLDGQYRFRDAVCNVTNVAAAILDGHLLYLEYQVVTVSVR